MSHQNPLGDLGLGAPIGGASSTGTTSGNRNNFSTSQTSAGAPVGSNYGGNTGTGVPGQHSYEAGHVHDDNCGHNQSSTTSGRTGSSGLTGQHSYEAGHVHDQNCGHDQSSATSGLTGSSGSRNTTSGDLGIGRGSGGPTAFESDASKVGENRSTGQHRSVGDRGTGRDNYDTTSGREHGSHGLTSGQGAATAAGLTGAGAGLTGSHSHGGQSAGSDLRDREAGIEAGLGAGHHDQSSTGTRSGLESGSAGLNSGLQSHHQAAIGAAGIGAGGIALTGRQATKIDSDGLIQDSVTGQTHFVDSGAGGYQQQNTSSGLGAGAAGLGAGAAGLSSQQQGQSGLTDKLRQSTGTHTEGGPISELKQELKEHESGQGADHPESKGPHGLVWHNGKYVHEREISGHGSTGVPLR